MARRLFVFVALILLSGNALGKCRPPDSHKLVSTREILKSTLPKGVEIFDRVWLKNPTATAFITYRREKGAAARTGYRKLLGPVPTTKDELPIMKLVNGEHFEYGYPANPVYGDRDDPDRSPTPGGWVHQNYSAGLIEPPLPVIPPPLVDRIFTGKTKVLAVKVPVPYYFGKKRGQVQFVYEFTKNPKYGIIDPNCPSPSPTPAPH
jgi:hypothetical protein